VTSRTPKVANYFGTTIHRPASRSKLPGQIKTGVAYCPQLPFRRIDPLSREGELAIMNARSQKLAKADPSNIAALAKIKPVPIRSPISEYEAERSIANRLDGQTDFRRWKDLFFVIRSSYTITLAGRECLGIRSEAGRRINIGALIDAGKAVELLDAGYIRPVVSWSGDAVVQSVVSKMMELRGKDPRTVRRPDFNSSELGALLSERFEGSIYACLVKTGHAYSLDEIRGFSAAMYFPDKKAYPWEMEWTPAIYHDEEIRIAVVRWLARGEPEKLSTVTFKKNGCESLLNRYYGASAYAALVEAGYAYSLDEVKAFSVVVKFPGSKLYPWEMRICPNVFDDAEIRVAAVRWLVAKTAKAPADISYDDFRQNGIGAVLKKSPRQSPYLALVDAGYAYSHEDICRFSASRAFGSDKIYPWEMNKTYIYGDPEMRKAAVRWLVWKKRNESSETDQGSGQNPSRRYFYANCLGGLLHSYFGNSAPNALRFAA